MIPIVVYHDCLGSLHRKQEKFGIYHTSRHHVFSIYYHLVLKWLWLFKVFRLSIFKNSFNRKLDVLSTVVLSDYWKFYLFTFLFRMDEQIQMIIQFKAQNHNWSRQEYTVCNFIIISFHIQACYTCLPSIHCISHLSNMYSFNFLFHISM